MQILFVLAFAATSAIAAPFAVCQHADASAHAAALASSEVSEAMAAQIEDSAEAAEKQGSITESAAGLLAAMMLPDFHATMSRGLAQVVGCFAGSPTELAERLIPPLLEPPLA